jgi:hypothetical protein
MAGVKGLELGNVGLIDCRPNPLVCQNICVPDSFGEEPQKTDADHAGAVTRTDGPRTSSKNGSASSHRGNTNTSNRERHRMQHSAGLNRGKSRSLKAGLPHEEALAFLLLFSFHAARGEPLWQTRLRSTG